MALYKLTYSDGKFIKQKIYHKFKQLPTYTPVVPTGLYSILFTGSGHLIANKTSMLDYDYSDEFTLSFWYRPLGMSSGSFTQCILSRYNDTIPQLAVDYSRTVPYPRFKLGTTSGVYNSSDTSLRFVDNSWTHYAVTYSGGVSKLFFNGIQYNPNVNKIGVGNYPTGLALIGSDNTGAHFIGNVYNLATWSRVLSGSEIYDLAHFSFDYRNNYNNYVSNNLTEYYLDTVNESSYNLPNAINDTQYFVLAGTGSGVVSSEDLPSFPGNVKITFTSPNSSDTIEPFDNYVIEWSNLGPSERVELFLCSGSEIIDTVTLNASAASGTHIWSVGEYVSGDYYLIARNVISGIVGTSETFSYVNLYNTYSNGGLTVYPTSRLVHLFVSGNIPSSSQWEIRRSPDDVTYTKLNNPSPSYNTQGFYRNTTKYFVDGNVEPGSGYYYQLYSYDGSYTLSGQVYVTLPTAGADLFEDFTSNHPGIGLSRTGFNSISQVRSNLLLTEPVDYAFALQANLNQDQAGSLRSYNVNISGANFDYYSVESGSWSLQLNGLSQNDFLSTLTHVGSVVSNGMYLHYITNDVLVKERAMSAFRSFISQYTAYSGQYQDAFTITDYEGIVGSIFTSAYDVCYGYLTQDERDAFAQMSYNLARHITYTVGFDAARLGDTHSNEDTAILLKQLIVLLAGDITDSTLRSNIQSLFDSYLLIYSGVLDQYNDLYFSDGSGGSTPIAGEYEFNEVGRMLSLMQTLYNLSGIDFFSYISGGLVNRSKYITHMTYPDGRSVNTGDGGYLYIDPRNHVYNANYFNDPIAARQAQLQWHRINPYDINYDFSYKAQASMEIPSGVGASHSGYELDWYSKNKGMLLSRSSWDDDAVILQVFAPRHQHYDKLSYDDGSFTIYYKGLQVPRAGKYDSSNDSHDNGYRKRTYAGNTITVNQSGELFVDNVYDPGVTSAGAYTVRSNNGDQPIRRLITSYTDYSKIDRRHGNTMYLSIQSNGWDISYLRCDLTPAYWRYTSASNYQKMFDKKVSDVTREFFFVKPSGIVVLDRIITTNSGYVQKNIVHFEKEPTIYASSTAVIVPKVGISGGIDLFTSQTSGYTEVFESGYMGLAFIESQPVHMYKIGGVGYEYWDSASGINRPPTVYDADTTGTYDDTEYGRGKWRVEWQPSGYVTTGLYAWVFLPLTSGQSYPSSRPMLKTISQVYPTNTRSYQYDTLMINTNASTNSGIVNSRYLGIGISGHLFVGLYPRTNFTFKVQNSIGTITYQTYSFTSADVDYSFGDLNETSYNMISSGYQFIFPTGLSPVAIYRYLLQPVSTDARNEATLDSTLQSGLQLWLVGEDLNYSYDSDVLLWTDRINGFIASGHVLPYGKMRNNLWEGNYHKAVRFGDFDSDTRPDMRAITASGYLQINHNSLLNVSTTAGYAVFVVHYPRIISASVRQAIIDKGMSNPTGGQKSWSMQIKDGFYQTFVRNSVGTQTLANTPAVSELSIDSFIMQNPGVTTSPLTLYHNGFLVENEALAANINTGSTEPIRIGFAYAGATGSEGVVSNYVYPYVGDVYEVLIYNSGLNNEVVSGVWSYLASKYNISMSGYSL